MLNQSHSSTDIVGSSSNTRTRLRFNMLKQRTASTASLLKTEAENAGSIAGESNTDSNTYTYTTADMVNDDTIDSSNKTKESFWSLSNPNVFLNYSSVVIFVISPLMLVYLIYFSTETNNHNMKTGHTHVHETQIDSLRIVSAESVPELRKKSESAEYHSIEYQNTSVIVMCELLKISIAIGIVFFENAMNIPKTMDIMLFEVFQVHTFAIPGIFYAISNVIMLKTICEIGIVCFQCYSYLFQLLFTPLIWKYFFNAKKLNNKQWLALLVILLSIVCFSLDFSSTYHNIQQKSNNGLGRESMFIFSLDSLTSTTSKNSIVDANVVYDLERTHNLHDSNSIGNGNGSHFEMFFGFATKRKLNFQKIWIYLILQSLLLSMANVYAEYKYKLEPKNNEVRLSYFAQSSSMYLWSMVASSIQFYLYNIKKVSRELLLLNLNFALQGFNGYTWLIVLLLTAQGISLGYILKYLHAVWQLLMIVISICLLQLIMNLVLLDNNSNTEVGVGAATNADNNNYMFSVFGIAGYVSVILAFWLYFRK